MPTRIALGVFAGLISAAMFSITMTGVPLALLAGYFASLPLFAVGLARGYLMAGLGGLTGMVAIASIGGVVFAVPFLMAFAAPVTVLVRQALLARPSQGGGMEWYPAGHLVVVLASLAVVLFAGSLVTLGMTSGNAMATLESLVRDTVEQINPVVSSRLTPEGVSLTAALVPGLAAASWMVMVALNGMLAQTILRRREWNVRPGGDLASMVVPTWPALAAAGGGLLLWAGDGWAALLGGLVTFVAAVVYLFLGLAVVHTVSRAWTWRTPALVFFYGALILVYQITVPAVVLLGLIEPWLGIRARVIAAGGREE